MINKKTVFILGAGSNVTYGFPTGVQLRYIILTEFLAQQQNMISFWTRSGWDQQIEREQIMNSTRDFLKKFERSGNKSIDLFLSRSPSHIKMGKTAIIKTIKG